MSAMTFKYAVTIRWYIKLHTTTETWKALSNQRYSKHVVYDAVFDPYDQEYAVQSDGIYSATFCELKFCTPGTSWKCGDTGKCRFIGMEKIKLMKKTISAAKLSYTTEDTEYEKNYKEISWYVRGLGMVKQLSTWMEIIDDGKGRESLKYSITLVKVKNPKRSKNSTNR